LFLNFFHFSIVVGNSMQPVLQPDDIILVDKGSDNVQEGQIIIFNHSIKDQYIVHRVIDKNKNGYITKGDNNQYRDDITVREENIYGKVVTKSTEQTINIKLMKFLFLDNMAISFSFFYFILVVGTIY
jgi:signal peptidase I